jgi:curli biogenesis system outer membrane secretion channel CsgG
MPTLSRLTPLLLILTLSACGAGETAAIATVQAQLAEQARQQMEQLQQQIDQANTVNKQRLEQALQKAEYPPGWPGPA